MNTVYVVCRLRRSGQYRREPGSIEQPTLDAAWSEAEDQRELKGRTFSIGALRSDGTIRPLTDVELAELRAIRDQTAERTV